jgi:hypothetical protein
MLSELGAAIVPARVHFLGQVDYGTYLNVLQVLSAHVYLTCPFVLSWSFIEAMASGCVMLASATAPVLEVLEDGVNGLAVDFFSPQDLANRRKSRHKYGTSTGFPRHSPIASSEELTKFVVARDRIELPTRGFSVQCPKPTNLLESLLTVLPECPIFLRDTGS